MTDNNTKKNKVYNSTIIKALSDKYNVSNSLVYRSLNSERSSIAAIQIRKDYKRLHSLITPIINSHEQQIDLIIEDFIKAENADS